jgi:hypothetical protein
MLQLFCVYVYVYACVCALHVTMPGAAVFEVGIVWQGGQYMTKKVVTLMGISGLVNP